MATPINLPCRRFGFIASITRRALTVILSLLLFLPLSNSQSLGKATDAQIPAAVKLTLGDTTAIFFNGLNPLSPLSSAPEVTPPPPQYWVFWLYGDGNFGWTKSSPQNSWDKLSYHLYHIPQTTGGPPVMNKTYSTKAYASGLYGGGNPPPKRVNGNVNVQLEDNLPNATTPAVEEGVYLNLQPHITPGLQGDTNVWILSIKNPEKTGPNQPVSGQVYLFYNGLLEEMKVTYSRGGGRDTSFVPAKVGGVKQFMNSSIDEVMNDHPANLVDNLPFKVNSIPTTALSNQFSKAYFWTFQNLQVNEERHLFIQMTNDTMLLSKYDPKVEARQSLMAALALDPVFQNNEPTNVNPVLTDAKQQLVADFNLSDFLQQANNNDPDGNWFSNAVNQADQTPLRGVPSSNIVDVYMAKSKVSDAYDPNYMRLEACSCPPGGDGAQQLLCTVNFQNDGLQPTTNVFITIDMPEGIQMESLFDSLLYLHPEITSGTAGTVQVIKSTSPGSRTVTWKLLNFAIQPTQIFGPGNDATYGQIVFTMLTKPGFSIKDLEPMYACVRFNQENAPEVCTEKVQPIILTQGDGASAQILTCQECDCPPFNFMDWLRSLPWWAYLLVLLLLLLLIWLIRKVL
ncbi:MAG TPA: hypothetical protein PKE06_14580 [Flavilitoribacter sp.]|nr:hypothetical protein [Flavilitoribacter sp.]